MSFRLAMNVYSAVKPFYFVSKLLGIFPKTFIGPAEKGVLQKTFFDGFTSCCAFIIMIACGIANAVLSEPFAINSVILQSAWNVILVISLFTFSLMFIIEIRRSDSIVAFLKHVEEYDKEARLLNIQPDFDQHKRFVTKVTTCTAIVTCLFTSVDPILNLLRGQISMNEISYSYLQFYISAYILQFIFACLAIRVRFKELNRFVMEQDMDATNVQMMTKLFHELCDGIELINGTFTLQLLPIMAYFMTTNIFSAYATLREIKNVNFDWNFFIFTGGYLVFQYFAKIVVVHIAYSTTAEAEKFTVVTCKAINDLKIKEEVRHGLEKLLTQQKYRNFKLQNVMFNIDWKLLVIVS